MSLLNEKSQVLSTSNPIRNDNASATLKTIVETNSQTKCATDNYTYDNLYEDVQKVASISDDGVETSEYDLEIFKVQSEKAFFDDNLYSVKNTEAKQFKDTISKIQSQSKCKDVIKVPIKPIFKVSIHLIKLRVILCNYRPNLTENKS